ncbi:MAG: hypothetical protein HOE30_03010 [Deltaproteobacteria bacterium]|jgi:signal transduction histidine kinase|nr:hypothetical protein [Deltaproteobacteria bacterium]MBT4087440.1 hypothetical protein [Deltaproteobacteria bacterium]MBT4269022.1 hypothetical protein [Deltaproteobacteria bacterium]MBT4638883.1 hypothetical protein [Deltaproteobacteria bacterium]MBT6501238.1 hypothetical protein [Deltaproteobacteria bacterium]
MRNKYHFFLLTVFLLMGLASQGAVAKTKPAAKKGVMDLQAWDLKVDGTVNLDGEWEFYWDHLLSPDDFRQGLGDLNPAYISVPGYWDKFEVDGKPLGGIGVATFRLRLKNLEPGQLLSLDIPLMHTAYTLWCNGRIISQNGVVGRSPQDSIPQYLPKTPGFVSGESELELVLQVSNFSHNNGGIWQTLKLGTNQTIGGIGQLRTAFDLFLLGAIFIMSIYHFGLFALRRKEGSPMFFGLFCLLISFRLSIHGSTILSVMFPDLSWELLAKLDYMVLYFGLLFFSAFIHSLYPQEFSRKILNLIVLLAAGFVLFTTVVPARIFTASLVYFQAIMGLSCLYYLYVMIRASFRKREGAIVVLGGCVVLIASMVNDVLYNHEIIHTADLVGAGLFVMIFSQSFVLSMRFSKAFFTVEELSANLEEQVKDRTAAIKDLLDNTGQGFFSFTSDYTIQRYTSRAVQEFFGKPIKNEHALKMLFPENLKERQEIMDLIFEQNGNLHLFEELLPSEMANDGNVYQIDYHWIPAQNRLTGRIMIVLTDITTQRGLEHKLKEDEERNQMIVKIAVDRHGFLDFLNAIKRCITEARRNLAMPLSDIQPDILFRQYHTVKGGLASYMFKEGAEKAHFIESQMEPVRSGKEQLSVELVGVIKAETEELEILLQKTLQGLEHVLPKELLSTGNQDFFRIAEKKIQALEAALSHSPTVDPTIREAVLDLRKQPVRNIMKKFAEDATELGKQLNKPLKVKLKGEKTEIIHAPFKPFFASLIHLIRNAVDHGIETADMRMMQGKPETGELVIEVHVEGNDFIIAISDDGGGINDSMVKSKAVEKGLITSEQAETISEQEAAQLIFKPGFSTNETVSDLSGRGVGMDAVASEVADLDGRIDINSRIDQGTCFTITLPMPSQL